MNPTEADRHPFIMRIWLEGEAVLGQPVPWRAEVVYVPTGQRKLVQSWDALRRFVYSFIAATDGAATDDTTSDAAGGECRQPGSGHLPDPLST